MSVDRTARTSPGKVRIVLFSGGRGAASISTALNRHSQVHLSVLVNTYDDGLSTGRIRAFLPGMLGPSDIRKNVTTLMPIHDRAKRALRDLLEYRLPEGIDRAPAIHELLQLGAVDGSHRIKSLAGLQQLLSVQDARWVSQCCATFLSYEAEQVRDNNPFDFGDCAIGNLVFGGCYLRNNRQFNAAVKEYAACCECSSEILNITNGANLVLVGVKQDGRLLPREADIVGPQDAVRLEDIFLLTDYLGPGKIAEIHGLESRKAIEQLRTLESFPEPNPDAITALQSADIIVYGPGTQYSSLFPSYLTIGVGEAIAGNTKAIKLFVTNLRHDHDIQALRADELLGGLERFLSRKGTLRLALADTVTDIFVQNPDSERNDGKAAPSYVPFDLSKFLGSKVWARDREGLVGRHIGGQIVDELIDLLAARRKTQLKPLRHMVSIVVPVLDEERTIEKVLSDLDALDFSALGIEKEIIVVDGGSTDHSFELASKYSRVRSYKLGDASRSRGKVLRFGINKARGDLVVFFPSDNEYSAGDIDTLVVPIVNGQYKAVFGSRLIKCLDLRSQIAKVYGPDNWVAYALSKYGGMAISILSLLFFNRFVTDPFSTLKAFDAASLRSLKLESEGVDLETEIIAKLSRQQLYFLEVPVSYTPRPKGAGKKMGASDGIKALFGLLKWRLRRFDAVSLGGRAETA